jgi:GMP synthase-like glutamine amidotransferase
VPGEDFGAAAGTLTMRRVLIFQHMDHDNAGRFMDFFAEDGFMPKAIRLWEGQPVPALDTYDLLLVLGGAQDTWQTDEYPWLVAEKEAIREWTMVLAKPYIGLCLGHQLLAEALGGTVGLASRSEVGVKEVMVTSEGLRHPFFTGISGTYSVVQWHFAEVKTVPPSAAVLAASSDTAVQAMAIDRHAIGLQFHAEFTPQTVASWESLPGYIASLEANLGPGAYERVAAEAYPMMPGLAVLTRRIYDNLLGASGLKKRSWPNKSMASD